MIGAERQGDLLAESVPRLRLPQDLKGAQIQAFWLRGIKPAWRPLVQSFFASEEGLALHARLLGDTLSGVNVFPPEPLRLLQLLEPPSARVVILGQDPYHGPYQAQGLSFSVENGVRCPPSLKNIFLELNRDLGLPIPQSERSSLMPWVERGVFLLNTCLSVRQGEPASHAQWGWEGLTQAVIESVLKASNACVFMLWGAHAKRFEPSIKAWAREYRTPVLILEAHHPSPLSARRAPEPFIGCGHFSQSQAWLKAQGLQWEWTL
jgi:uracil-DNA glycosylase